MTAKVEAKCRELANAIKAEAAMGAKLPSETIFKIASEAQELLAQSQRLARKLQRRIGLSDEELRQIEQADDALRLPRVGDLWRAEIVKTRPTEDLDDLLEMGLENLLRKVDTKWLSREAEKPHRLDPDYLLNPLHLVNGVRVGAAPRKPGPNRFAQMLLLSQDHLNKENDLDFFSASTFVPEIAMLGNSLEEMDQLGPEAQRKLSALASMPDDLVTSTIFELLVGAAWVRRGHSITMVPESKARKVPDFSLSGLGAFAGAVECKRRLGLSKYELDEAQCVAELYQTIRGPLRKWDVNASVEAAFTVEVQDINKAEFVEQILKSTLDRSWDQLLVTSWGSYTVRQLHRYKSVTDTRLYSPDFLESAFGWKPDQDEWDGLLCEVESPSRISVGRFRNPLCLKWRSESEVALLKKSRGIMSLWTSAVEQIPPGEIGFVYIAYPEGSRAAVADARTKHINDSLHEAWHTWSKRVPVTIINRLYARPLGVGVPDLIENSMQGATEGQEFWLKDIPWLIFTRQFERRE